MTRSASLILLFWLHFTFKSSQVVQAQNVEADTIKITFVEEKAEHLPDTMVILIRHQNMNWFQVDAFTPRGNHIYRRIHLHRIKKFMRKFHEIPVDWRDYDSSPMTFITVDGYGKKIHKRSPAALSRPKHLRHILKIWK